MIESLDNAVQLLITGICTGIAAYNAVKHRRKEWALTGLFSGVFFMGNLYWLLYLVFYSTTPMYSGIPYMSWYASYIFLILLMLEVKESEKKIRVKLLVPVLIFTSGMCVYYMQFGSYISNTVSALLMSFLIYGSLNRLLTSDANQSGNKGSRMVCISILLFCILEYALWTASCIGSGDSIADPYYWFDFLLTADFVLITLSARKAASYGLY